MVAQPVSQQQILPVRYQRLEAVMRRAGELTMEYWALTLTLFLGLIVLAALSVPLLTYLGLDSIAKPLFFTLHLICAQIPSHSFYILGHQLGMCARNMSIYGSMFVGGLVFVLSKKRLPGIPWWVWVLMILPMAYDGLTQMFGLRESTWELRVITGVLFGIGNMWFALPFIQRTLLQTITAPGPVLYPSQSAQYASVQASAVAMQPLVPVQVSALVESQDLETPLPPSEATLAVSQPGLDTREDEAASQSQEPAQPVILEG